MVYTFGDCRLDLDRRELWRGGAQIGLEPPVFDLLPICARLDGGRHDPHAG
ncbi:MAG TPA: hypothetical protein VGR45_06365 [Stellaceae bacterium]|nr:hypothetical protein [Stellaceae bacterium]